LPTRRWRVEAAVSCGGRVGDGARKELVEAAIETSCGLAVEAIMAAIERLQGGK